MAIAKILLPVDFSQAGLGAARHAAALARHFGAELTLFHANPIFAAGLGLPGEFGGPIDTGWVAALEARRYQDLVGYHPEEFSGVRLKRVVVTGEPARSIVEHAAKEGIGLIVMPTHGYGGFRRSLLGSVTAKVLHDAPCPVWTGAHLEEAAPPQWRTLDRILCAIDNSEVSEQVLRWAHDFGREFNADLTVVHALPELPAPDGFLDPEIRRRRMESALEAVRCLQNKTGARGEVVIVEGEPSKVVAAEALRRQAGVAVIGRTPAARGQGRLRSHAYAIVRDAPCPVVSV